MKSIRALVFTQKDATLFCFTMNAMDLEPLCFVEAAARDKEKGLQRVTELSRLREIGEFLATGENSFLPNNIILNLKPDVQIDIDLTERWRQLRFPQRPEITRSLWMDNIGYSRLETSTGVFQRRRCSNCPSCVSRMLLKRSWAQHSSLSMSIKSLLTVTF